MELPKKIKELRTKKGFSQEELSEESGISLRTVQRIENGETEPRGDTLRRLANVLGASPDELIDWTIQENRGYLVFLNLSALGFILFPLLGILIPFIMLTVKKDMIKDINKIGRALVNFEITWNIIIFILFIICLPTLIKMKFGGGGMFSVSEFYIFILTVLLYVYNLILIFINSIRIHNKKTTIYAPSIRFIRS